MAFAVLWLNNNPTQNNKEQHHECISTSNFNLRRRKPRIIKLEHLEWRLPYSGSITTQPKTIRSNIMNVLALQTLTSEEENQELLSWSILSGVCRTLAQ
ncbi:hypothetical protein [Arsukibacterium ikkense]|uniref:hypothetical protein n=1 Tax=Arsukibacterium ikkense TaxID=336831 RepID=UPI00128C5529|nr:hypothetical protein [Arsukibacterium ikkense]